MIKQKEFIDKDNHVLILCKDGNKILFKHVEEDLESRRYRYEYKFDNKTFVDIFYYLQELIKENWKDIRLHPVNTLSNDYEEIYDKEFDDNCSVSIYKNMLIFDKCLDDNTRLVRLTKTYAATFLYDYQKIIQSMSIRKEI